MDQIVVDLGVSVHERWKLNKNHIAPLPGNDGGKRLCVVTGIHGDKLEWQYVAFLLNQELQRHPEYLRGTVDIYCPCLFRWDQASRAGQDSHGAASWVAAAEGDSDAHDTARSRFAAGADWRGRRGAVAGDGHRRGCGGDWLPDGHLVCR